MFDPFHNWHDEMFALARNDPWYIRCATEQTRLEPACLRIRESLTQDQQEALDDYISACEEVMFSLVYSAYVLGRRQGGT